VRGASYRNACLAPWKATWKAEMRGGKRSTSIQRGEVRNPLGKNQYAPGAAAAAKKIIADVKELAKELTPKAMTALEGVLDNEKAPAAAKVSAAIAILDRGWGKPRETVDVTHRKTLEELVKESYQLERELAAEKEADKLQ
jgi:hypothetical protein